MASHPRWLPHISQLTRRCYETTSNNKGLLCLPRLYRGATFCDDLRWVCLPITNLQLQLSVPGWLPIVRVRVRVKVTLRLAVYHQSVRLGVKPLETQDQILFQVNPCGHSPYVTSSLTRRWVCLLWICLAFCKVYVSHIQHVIGNFSFCTIYKSCQPRVCKADHSSRTYATTAA
jgi:hypothetical protein